MVSHFQVYRTWRNLTRALSYGKPQVSAFRCAARVLERWCKDHYGFGSSPETAYFVGHTPESDVRGTKGPDSLVYEAGAAPGHNPGATIDTALNVVFFGMGRLKTVITVKSRWGSINSTGEEEDGDEERGNEATDYGTRDCGVVARSLLSAHF
ncbi:hypothetical protein C7212DRAFT_345076 [Tuber magnatum]|uniref:Uncharacterized protein n=1 Tax=Tuber magnatum TaxID=42249 RepID=A0A317SV06_9PEZI|nr:hypothetical protein C7212DRAFT_345076 [Tuber magnatum]